MYSFKFVTVLLTIFLFISCSDKNELIEYQECIDGFLVQYEMKAYNGGDIPCNKSYLVLFENDITTFALIKNNCADLVPQLLIGCNGEELCTYLTEDGCFAMTLESKNLGIIGVK